MVIKKTANDLNTDWMNVEMSLINTTKKISGFEDYINLWQSQSTDNLIANFDAPATTESLSTCGREYINLSDLNDWSLAP